MMLKAVLLDPATPEELAYYAGFAPGVTLRAPERDDPEALAALLPGSDVLIAKRVPVTDAVLERAGPGVRLVQRWSNRRDGVDLEAAGRRNVPVALAPQVGGIAVAEMTLLLMLGLSKRIVQADRSTRSGAYRELGLVPERTAERKHAFQWMKLPGLFELHGRTLGLIGYGEIATEVSRRARAFGMRVLYTKRRRLPGDIEAEEGVAFRPQEELLAESDFVSLHVPHTPETERLIDGAALARMPSSSYLVNTCRGGVVDERALVEALTDGGIAGAGIDVYVEEPVPHDHPLLALENVLLAPHIGGGSGGARMKHARDTLANLLRLQRGEPLQHVITAKGEVQA